MPKLESHTMIEDGMVMGYVNLDSGRGTFEICTVEEWVKMSEGEAEETARQAFNESGIVEWGY